MVSVKGGIDLRKKIEEVTFLMISAIRELLCGGDGVAITVWNLQQGSRGQGIAMKDLSWGSHTTGCAALEFW